MEPHHSVKEPCWPDIIAVRADNRENEPPPASGRPNSCDVLSVYLQGGPRYRLDGRLYAIRPPMAFLIPRGTLDGDLQTGRVEGWFLMFHGHGLLRRTPGRRGYNLVVLGSQHLVVPGCQNIRRAEAQRLAELLRELATVRAAGCAGQVRRLALFFQALATYCLAGLPADHPGVHREAWHLRELLEARALEDRALDEIYAALPISAAHAAKLFQAAFHLTPVAYRRQLRLRRARELLAGSMLNVGQIARAVGFDDPLYFSRLFRREFGQTPSSLVRAFAGRRRGSL